MSLRPIRALAATAVSPIFALAPAALAATPRVPCAARAQGAPAPCTAPRLARPRALHRPAPCAPAPRHPRRALRARALGMRLPELSCYVRHVVLRSRSLRVKKVLPGRKGARYGAFSTRRPFSNMETSTLLPLAQL